MAQARAVGLNAIRITDYLDVHSAPDVGPYDPASDQNTYGLTAPALVRFYDRVLTQWHRLAPGQLRTVGGLYQLDWNSGIPWKTIFSLPGNDVDALHVYGAGDRSTTVPTVAAFSRSQHKPWIIEEFGFDARDGDQARAAGFHDTFALGRKYGAAGVGFWNLGSQTGMTYDVGPQFPQTMDVAKAHTSTSGAVR